MKINEIESFIKYKYKELLDNNGGIVLLKNINRQCIERIHEISKEYIDMASFSIKDPKTQEKHMVLRYKSPIYITPNFSSMFIEANLAYLNGDYNRCIDIYNKVLQYGKSNNKTFAILGFAYAKTGNHKKAIEYLTIANCTLPDQSFSETILMLESINSNNDEEQIDTNNSISLLRSLYKRILLNEEIVILDSLDKDESEEIKRLISKFPGISYFSTRNNEKEQIILKEALPIYMPITSTKKIRSDILKKYSDQKYDECINESKKYLRVSTPTYDDLLIIGLSYAKKEDYEKASMYLDIAESMTEKETQPIIKDAANQKKLCKKSILLN